MGNTFSEAFVIVNCNICPDNVSVCLLLSLCACV